MKAYKVTEQWVTLVDEDTGASALLVHDTLGDAHAQGLHIASKGKQVKLFKQVRVYKPGPPTWEGSLD